MTKTAVVLEAVTPINGKRPDFFVPKTAEGCRRHIRSMSDIEARMH